MMLFSQNKENKILFGPPPPKKKKKNRRDTNGRNMVASTCVSLYQRSETWIFNRSN